MYSHLTDAPYPRACAHARRRAQTVVQETLVTIVLPVSADICATKATLAAALTQSHELTEVLLVGPGGIVQPMREYGQDHRIRTIAVKTAPDDPAAALNAGLQKARGAYISFVRPGILVSSDWIEARLRAMQGRGLHAAYQGGPGARDITARDLIEGAWVTIESVMIHRLVAAGGFRFDGAALGMGDGAALVQLAHPRPLVSLAA